jgi:hypothetical protein
MRMNNVALLEVAAVLEEVRVMAELHRHAWALHD